jgi:hypothetical protein
MYFVSCQYVATFKWASGLRIYCELSGAVVIYELIRVSGNLLPMENS